MSDFCRFYPSHGLAFNDHCEAGVEMANVRDASVPHRYPCFDPSVARLCPHHQPYTAEENAAMDQAVAEVIKRLDGVMGWTKVGEEESDAAPMMCLVCGYDIDSLDQVGACVYARPCGCRQGQFDLSDDQK